jgi:hypothetical protein
MSLVFKLYNPPEPLLGVKSVAVGCLTNKIWTANFFFNFQIIL